MVSIEDLDQIGQALEHVSDTRRRVGGLVKLRIGLMRAMKTDEKDWGGKFDGANEAIRDGEQLLESISGQKRGVKLAKNTIAETCRILVSTTELIAADLENIVREMNQSEFMTKTNSINERFEELRVEFGGQRAMIEHEWSTIGDVREQLELQDREQAEWVRDVKGLRDNIEEMRERVRRMSEDIDGLSAERKNAMEHGKSMVDAFEGMIVEEGKARDRADNEIRNEMKASMAKIDRMKETIKRVKQLVSQVVELDGFQQTTASEFRKVRRHGLKQVTAKVEETNGNIEVLTRIDGRRKHDMGKVDKELGEMKIAVDYETRAIEKAGERFSSRQNKLRGFLDRVEQAEKDLEDNQMALEQHQRDTKAVMREVHMENDEEVHKATRRANGVEQSMVSQFQVFQSGVMSNLSEIVTGVQTAENRAVELRKELETNISRCKEIVQDIHAEMKVFVQEATKDMQSTAEFTEAKEAEMKKRVSAYTEKSEEDLNIAVAKIDENSISVSEGGDKDIKSMVATLQHIQKDVESSMRRSTRKIEATRTELEDNAVNHRKEVEKNAAKLRKKSAIMKGNVEESIASTCAKARRRFKKDEKRASRLVAKADEAARTFGIGFTEQLSDMKVELVEAKARLQQMGDDMDERNRGIRKGFDNFGKRVADDIESVVRDDEKVSKDMEVVVARMRDIQGTVDSGIQRNREGHAEGLLKVQEKLDRLVDRCNRMYADCETSGRVLSEQRGDMRRMKADAEAHMSSIQKAVKVESDAIITPAEQSLAAVVWGVKALVGDDLKQGGKHVKRLLSVHKDAKARIDESDATMKKRRGEFAEMFADFKSVEDNECDAIRASVVESRSGTVHHLEEMLDNYTTELGDMISNVTAEIEELETKMITFIGDRTITMTDVIRDFADLKLTTADRFRMIASTIGQIRVDFQTGDDTTTSECESVIKAIRDEMDVLRSSITNEMEKIRNDVVAIDRQQKKQDTELQQQLDVLTGGSQLTVPIIVERYTDLKTDSNETKAKRIAEIGDKEQSVSEEFQRIHGRLDVARGSGRGDIRDAMEMVNVLQQMGNRYLTRLAHEGTEIVSQGNELRQQGEIISADIAARASVLSRSMVCTREELAATSAQMKAEVRLILENVEARIREDTAGVKSDLSQERHIIRTKHVNDIAMVSERGATLLPELVPMLESAKQCEAKLKIAGEFEGILADKFKETIDKAEVKATNTLDSTFSNAQRIALAAQDEIKSSHEQLDADARERFGELKLSVERHLDGCPNATIPHIESESEDLRMHIASVNRGLKRRTREIRGMTPTVTESNRERMAVATEECKVRMTEVRNCLMDHETRGVDVHAAVVALIDEHGPAVQAETKSLFSTLEKHLVRTTKREASNRCEPRAQLQERVTECSRLVRRVDRSSRKVSEKTRDFMTKMTGSIATELQVGGQCIRDSIVDMDARLGQMRPVK